ncbi:hypothetical protein D3C81_1709350 [compost metagenome]
MQAVGQFDEDDAHITRHRQQHFAEVFRLRLDLALEFDFFQLGQTVDQIGDRRAEAFDQLILAYILVFHHIMQQRRHDGLGIQLPVGADFGDRDRMRDVWFARHAHLAQMCLIREAIGFLDLLQFGGRQVFGKFGRELRDRGYACDWCGRGGRCGFFLGHFGRAVGNRSVSWSDGCC